MRSCSEWCEGLVQIGRNMGITFQQDKPYRIEQNYDPERGALPDLEMLKRDAARQGRKLDLVIVVLPNVSQHEIDRYYGKILYSLDV